jgi:hypothetical protein
MAVIVNGQARWVAPLETAFDACGRRFPGEFSFVLDVVPNDAAALDCDAVSYLHAEGRVSPR